MISNTKIILSCFLIICSLIHLSAQSSGNPLPACPKSPNCFASQFESKNWKKKPLTFNGNKAASIERLLELLDKMEGGSHVFSDAQLIHYTFETKIGKFIDDVYFHVDELNQCFHFKSVSRKGFSDMGANKRRMKKIRSLWEDKSS